MAPVVTLTTDFGLEDHYVAAVKGSILSINPDATIVDVAHAIPAQDVEQAAFLLRCTYEYFPEGSIHVAVVDPGVGTERRALALKVAGHVFVGPDNGVLSAALPDPVRQVASAAPAAVSLPESIGAYSVTNSRYHRTPVSPTFHARDIFGPVAAHLSLNLDIAELGPRVRELIALPPFRAERRADGSLRGRVIYADRFGNLITTIHADQLPSAGDVLVAGRVLSARARTYAEAAGPTILIGSCGFMEIAVNGGSAQIELNIDVGDPVIVRPA